MQTEAAVATASATAQDSASSRLFALVFGFVLLVGGIYAGRHRVLDLSGMRAHAIGPFIMLGIALLIALGFEFVNSVHDTANAVAAVIYPHAMPPNLAVIGSGAGACHPDRRHRPSGRQPPLAALGTARADGQRAQ